VLEKRIVQDEQGRQWIEVKGFDIPGELGKVPLKHDIYMLVGTGGDQKVHPAYIYYPMFGSWPWTWEDTQRPEFDNNLKSVLGQCMACQGITKAMTAVDRPTANVGVPAQLPTISTEVNDSQGINISKVVPLPYVAAAVDLGQQLICKRWGSYITSLLAAGIFDYMAGLSDDKGLKTGFKEVSDHFSAKLKVCKDDLPQFEADLKEAIDMWQKTGSLAEASKKAMFRSTSETLAKVKPTTMIKGKSVIVGEIPKVKALM